MNVTFTRTAHRRYRVDIEGPDIERSFMEPAPGYDPRLPHDMAHFVVENELGISRGIFGQLAAGGHARTFHSEGHTNRRKLARRGDRLAGANKDDLALSEQIVYIACGVWKGEFRISDQNLDVHSEDIERICRRFDEVSVIWSGLGIGESMTLPWPNAKRR